MLAVLAVVTAILVPVVVSTREKGGAATCLSNVGQLTKASLLYADANDDRHPLHNWQLAVGMASGKRGEIQRPRLACPNYQAPLGPEKRITSPYRGGYALNGCLSHFDAPDSPSQIVMVAEVAAWEHNIVHGPPEALGRYVQASEMIQSPDDHAANETAEGMGAVLMGPVGQWGSRRHTNRGHYAFLDGHARTFESSAFLVPRGMPCGEVENPVASLPNRPRFASLPFGKYIH